MRGDMPFAIPAQESLTVEFKSDRKRLPDAELVEAVVCLTNAEGGELWLGVEDDGTPTGCTQTTAYCWALRAWWRRARRLR